MLARYPQAHVFDTTGLGGQNGPSPNDPVGSGAYTSYNVPNNINNATTPTGIGSIFLNKYRATATSNFETTQLPGTAYDEFNLWTNYSGGAPAYQIY